MNSFSFNTISQMSRNRVGSLISVEDGNFRRRSNVNDDFKYETDSIKEEITSKAFQVDIYGCQSTYQNLKPVILMMRMLGMLPIYNIAPGIFKFDIGTLPMLYSVLLYIVITMVTGIMVWDEKTTINTSEARFEQTVISYLFDIKLMPILLIPIMWYESPNLVITFNRWSQIERLYKRIKGRPMDMTFDNRPIVFAILLPILGLLITMIEHATLYKISLLKLLIHSYIITILFVFTGFWYLQCEILGIHGRIVSNDFEKILFNIGPASKISEYRALWIRLSDLTSNLGMASSYTVNGMILYCFVTITMSTYSIMGKIQQGIGTKDLGLLASGISSVLILYFLCNEAHYVIQNVRTDFQRKLLAVHLPWMTDDVYTEVNMFFKVFVINPSNISLGGFVIINRSLFKSIMATMVTYMVILLQLQITIPDETTDNINGTEIKNHTMNTTI